MRVTADAMAEALRHAWPGIVDCHRDALLIGRLNSWAVATLFGAPSREDGYSVPPILMTSRSGM